MKTSTLEGRGRSGARDCLATENSANYLSSILLDDKTVSNKHLRIYSIGFDVDAQSEVPTFAYAQDVSTNGTKLSRIHDLADPGKSHKSQSLNRQSNSVLLCHGDELRVCPDVKFVYWDLNHRKVPLQSQTYEQRMERKAFEHLYTISTRKIGVGGFGTVHVAYDKISGEQLACKIIDLQRLKQSPLQRNPAIVPRKDISETTDAQKRTDDLFREVQILKEVRHPNVIGMERVFWTESTLYIFQELVTAGDLFSYLEFRGGVLEDVSAAVIVRQILKGVEFLHYKNIVHRDLKPENVLMSSLSEGSRVVLTDFGQARYVQESSKHKGRMFSFVGSEFYAAPETSGSNPYMQPDDGYSKSVDIWSIGIITALLLTGDMLHFDKATKTFKARLDATVTYETSTRSGLVELTSQSNWIGVGKRAKTFIIQLLVLDETKRMTATEALKHEWFLNRHHIAEFEALYSRAIRSWKPRPKGSSVIQRLTVDVPNHSRAHATLRRRQTISQPVLPEQSHLTKSTALPKFRKAMPRIAEDEAEYIREPQESGLPRYADNSPSLRSIDGNTPPQSKSSSQMQLDSCSTTVIDSSQRSTDIPHVVFAGTAPAIGVEINMSNAAGKVSSKNVKKRKFSQEEACGLRTMHNAFSDGEEHSEIVENSEKLVEGTSKKLRLK